MKKVLGVITSQLHKPNSLFCKVPVTNHNTHSYANYHTKRTAIIKTKALKIAANKIVRFSDVIRLRITVFSIIIAQAAGLCSQSHSYLILFNIMQSLSA